MTTVLDSRTTLLSDHTEDAAKRSFFRFIAFLVAFLGVCNGAGIRINASLAMIDMVSPKEVFLHNSTVVVREFNWDERTKSEILSSFFWTYSIVNILSGFMVKAIGAKVSFGLSILMPSILTMLSPIVINIGGSGLFIALRIGQGLFEGVSFTSIIGFLSKWTPKSERTLVSSFVLTGNYFGFFGAMVLTGFIMDKLSWEAMFYIFGTIGIIWFVIWNWILTDVPETHPWINVQERNFIVTTRETSNIYEMDFKHLPLLQIVKSGPVWGIAVAIFAENWGLYLLLTQFPNYIANVYDVNIFETGLYSSLPYIIIGIFMIISGIILDLIRSKDVIGITRLRKIFLSVGFGGQVVFYILLAHATDAVSAVSFVCIGVLIGSLANSSYSGNIIDLSPTFSPFIMSFVNAVGMISASLTPVVCGMFIQKGTVEEWRAVFYITALNYAIGLILYLILGSSKKQSWNIEDNIQS